MWIFPNVKANHVEKTVHPCQFPVELAERFLLATTKPGDLVVDPYIGVRTTACAAVLNGRRAAGADIVAEYIAIAKERLVSAERRTLRTRPMNRPVHVPSPNSSLARRDDSGRTALRMTRRRTPPHGMRLRPRATEETQEALLPLTASQPPRD